MAIRIDGPARDAIARRRARGQVTALTLRITPVPHGGHRVSAAWAPRQAPLPWLVERRVGADVVYVDERIARYADWYDVTITAWRLGPLGFLVVLYEPRVMQEIAAWSRTHPVPPHAASGAGVRVC